MLEATELERRKPVWKALSEFYLDTELQPSDYDHVARVLGSSGFTLTELKAIDRFEVFPVLINNLLSPTGFWTAFEEPWLHEKCVIACKKKNHALVRLKNFIVYSLFVGIMKKQWREIEKRIE